MRSVYPGRSASKGPDLHELERVLIRGKLHLQASSLDPSDPLGDTNAVRVQLLTVPEHLWTRLFADLDVEQKRLSPLRLDLTPEPNIDRDGGFGLEPLVDRLELLRALTALCGCAEVRRQVQR